jgi:imidazole glycerol-phosphate synthase subunit HisH
MIGILDYGAGNLFSVANALNYLGLQNLLISKEQHFEKISKLLIPGVGAFGPAMQHLQRSALIEAIYRWVRQGNPILGICLGMQLFMESSEESPESKGLGLIQGCCKKFERGKTPNIGWLQVSYTENSTKTWFYFVHSYYLVPKDTASIKALAFNNEVFPAILSYENILGAQFHPEKSGADGLNFLKTWGETS